MKKLRVLILGVGSFAQSMMRILKEDGAEVFCYLTRSYAHWPPSLEGRVFEGKAHPSPAPLVREFRIDLVLPMSIDWAVQPWADELIASGVPILCPHGEALKIERDRDFARKLCDRFQVPFARSYFARNRAEALAILDRDRRAYVLKNPLCGPQSPLHTIVCEDPEETKSWIEMVDDREGIFLQEYLGRAEAGHIALVADGEIYSLATNQEYKRAFHGNQGIVAGAPLGGLVERDEEDKYGIASALLSPLIPWLRETSYHGPIQVTALKSRGEWHVVEYNVRLGVTSGAMILRLLTNPSEALLQCARNEKVSPKFDSAKRFGCSATLAGFGYPYTQIAGPELPVGVRGEFNCDVWWNETRVKGDRIFATGHRIADVVATDAALDRAIARVFENISKLSCHGSYFRADIGHSLWPPGNN